MNSKQTCVRVVCGFLALIRSLTVCGYSLLIVVMCFDYDQDLNDWAI